MRYKCPHCGQWDNPRTPSDAAEIMWSKHPFCGRGYWMNTVNGETFKEDPRLVPAGKRLPEADAKRVARCFNSIMVATEQIRTAKMELDCGQIGNKAFTERFDLWDRSILEACRILRSEFGIEPVGFEHKV